MTNLKNPGEWIIHNGVDVPEGIAPRDSVETVLCRGDNYVGQFNNWTWDIVGDCGIIKYRLPADHPVYATQEPSLIALEYVAKLSGWSGWDQLKNSIYSKPADGLRDHARLIEKHEPHRLDDPFITKARELFANTKINPTDDEAKCVSMMLREWGVKP
jgi:hypothetical protein